MEDKHVMKFIFDTGSENRFAWQYPDLEQQVKIRFIKIKGK